MKAEAVTALMARIEHQARQLEGSRPSEREQLYRGMVRDLLAVVRDYCVDRATTERARILLELLEPR